MDCYIYQGVGKYKEVMNNAPAGLHELLAKEGFKLYTESSDHQAFFKDLGDVGTLDFKVSNANSLEGSSVYSLIYESGDSEHSYFYPEFDTCKDVSQLSSLFEKLRIPDLFDVTLRLRVLAFDSSEAIELVPCESDQYLDWDASFAVKMEKII